MEQSSKKRNILLFCLLTAFLILMICTKSSFLYPFQDWEDDNIIFTVGRGMMQGKVPFRDLYDLKGPLAYFVFGLASLVSTKSYIGLFFIEVICSALFLYISYQTISLFEKKRAIFAIPVLGAITCSAMSFAHGGSLEELSLPIHAYALYSILRYYKEDYPNRMRFGILFLNGFLAGCLFWAKYTMLGFYLGWMGAMVILLLVEKRVKDAFRSALQFLFGMAAASVPWLIYFGVNGALSDLFHYYFYYNIFGYGVAGRTVWEMLFTIVKNTGATFFRNAQYSVLIILGVAYFTFINKTILRKQAKITLWAMCVFACVGIYMGETGFRYYGIILEALVPLGLVVLLKLLNNRKLVEWKKSVQTALLGGLLAVGVLYSFLVSDNTYMLSMTKEDLPQYVFARTMQQEKKEERITLLCYDILDFGFYMTSGYEPEFRFFTKLNNGAPEIEEQQNELLRNRSMEFVVSVSDKVPEGYTKIQEMSYLYEDGYRPTFYLYQRG